MHTRTFRSSPSPPRPRRHWGRRLFCWFLLLLLAGYGAWSYFIVPRQVIAGSQLALVQNQIAPVSSLNWPSYGAAAVGAVGYGVLASHGRSTALPTASTTKIMTALCVLSKHPLELGESGPTITLTQRDIDFYRSYIGRNGSVINVRVGERISQYQALQALLLRSANNMADTLAVWTFGSLTAYSEYANNYAEKLGLSDYTVGADASGFDPSTTSTASSLVQLGIAAMKNPVLAQIVSQKSAVIPDGGTVYNTNNLLGQHGIIGIKTGNNDQDPGVYLFAANYRPSRGDTVVVVGAIMGAAKLSDAKASAISLLSSTEAGFAPRTIVRAGQIVGRYTLPWGPVVNASAQKDLTLLGWQTRSPITHVNLQALMIPAAAGKTIGSLTANSGNGVVLSTPLILDQAAIKSSLLWRLKHPLE